MIRRYPLLLSWLVMSFFAYGYGADKLQDEWNFAPQISYIDMISTDDLTQEVVQEKLVKTFIQNGKLYITGLSNTADIEVYSILGKKLVELKSIKLNPTFSQNVSLSRNNMYIVRIQSPAFSKTFKVIAG